MVNEYIIDDNNTAVMPRKSLFEIDISLFKETIIIPIKAINIKTTE